MLLGVLRKVDHFSRVTLKRLSNSIQDEFLLLFTGCRKVLRKMPRVKDIMATERGQSGKILNLGS